NEGKFPHSGANRPCTRRAGFLWMTLHLDPVVGGSIDPSLPLLITSSTLNHPEPCLSKSSVRNRSLRRRPRLPRPPRPANNPIPSPAARPPIPFVPPKNPLPHPSKAP